MKGVAFVLVLLVVQALAGVADSAVKPQTINLLEVETSFVGTGGLDTSFNTLPKVGQGFVIESDFYKWNGTKRGAHVGTLHAVCTITKQNPAPTYTAWDVCTGAALLPGGQITLSGVIKQSDLFYIAIVGGTGVYAGAQGYVQIKSINDTNSNDKFVITG